MERSQFQSVFQPRCFLQPGKARPGEGTSSSSIAGNEAFLTSLFSANCRPVSSSSLTQMQPLNSGLPRVGSLTSLPPTRRLRQPASYGVSVHTAPLPRLRPTPSPRAASFSRAFCQDVTCSEPPVTTPLVEPSLTGLPACATVQSPTCRLNDALRPLCPRPTVEWEPPADETLSGFPRSKRGRWQGQRGLPRLPDSPALQPRDPRRGTVSCHPTHPPASGVCDFGGAQSPKGKGERVAE